MLSTLLILFGLLIILLILNVPIAFSLAIAGFVVLFLEGSVPFSFFIQSTFGASDSFSIIAIPLFILAGEIMSSGGIAKRLVAFVQSMVSTMTGGLGFITIVASLVFSALSGSGAATVASIGGIMIPYMIKEGYSKSYAASITASAGTFGPMIPPSIVLILYGVMASVSISDLFLAGIIPGLLMALALIFVNYFISKKEHFGEKQKVEDKGFWSALNDAKFGLLAPIIILGGIYAGIVTPTEAAVVAVVYSLLVSVFIYKELKIEELSPMFMRAALTSGTIIIFISTAAFFGQILSLEQIPQFIANAIASITTNEIIILLLLNVFLLIAGMFMETIAAIILFVPLLLPIIIPLGVDPIHFGIIVCLNLSIGLITPPLGINLFIASNIAEIKFESTFKYVGIIFVVILVVLLIITLVPQISTFLPSLLSP
ncbi:hypothetical protein GCM10008931_28410 [Oceanobacillus oncorhynchi subsp. oncorhynchi]|uniref:TRAP transporter large permease n=1 Tax=Oceanobacillus oncorhynchi TaxID=545501 RepID=UPI0031E30A6C